MTTATSTDTELKPKDAGLPEGITPVVRFAVGKVEFDTVADAAIYKGKLDIVEKVQGMLPQAVDNGCKFANGGGYIQHHPEAIEQFVKATETAIRKIHGDDLADQFAENPRSYVVGRTLDDSGSLLYSVVMRLHCIDPQNREWGQPGYAKQPYQGVQTPWENVA